MRHVYGLDIIRFSAALLVMLNHFSIYMVNTESPSFVNGVPAFPYLRIFDGIGATGVQIFFVISGFVIAKSAERQSGARAAIRFGFARALRILPALWISGIISLIAMSCTGAEIVPLLYRFAKSAVLSPIGPYIDGVVWSLVVEVVFYAVISLLILRRAALDLFKVAIVLGGVSAVYIAIFVTATLLGYESLQSILGRFVFKVILLRHGVFFAVGILVSEMLRPSTTLYSAERIRKGLPYLVFFSCFCFGEIWLQSLSYSGGVLASMLIWLAGVLALLYSIKARQTSRFIGVYQYLGGLSYTIYLNHYSTGMAAVFILSGAGLSGLTLFVTTLSLVLVISHTVLSLETGIRKALRPLLDWPLPRPRLAE